MKKTVVYCVIALIACAMIWAALASTKDNRSDTEKKIEEEHIAQIKNALEDLQPGDIIRLKSDYYALVQNRISGCTVVKYLGIGDGISKRMYDETFAPQVARIYYYEDPEWCFAIRKLIDPIIAERPEHLN